MDWYLPLGLQIDANDCLDLLFACARSSIFLSFVFIFLYAIIQIFLQMDYINTSHSSFIGGSKVVELAKHEGLSSRGPTSLSVHKVTSFPPQILYLFLNNVKRSPMWMTGMYLCNNEPLHLTALLVLSAE